MARNLHSFSTALILLSLLAPSFSASSQADVLELVEKWANRDGVATIEVGYDLSEAFVANPQVFLDVMVGKPEIWDTWLSALPTHSLTVFLEGAIPQYKRLKTNMIEATEAHLSCDNHGALAKALRAKLLETDIREID